MLTAHQISQAYAIPVEDVEFALAASLQDGLTVLAEPCWIGGPDKFRVGLKTFNPLRAIAETALGRPLDPAWRFHRKCPTTACRNPLHYVTEIAWLQAGDREPEDTP